jgi:hypothetical protein
MHRGGHDLDVLRRGEWIAMHGTAVEGRDHPDEVAPLLAAYLALFIKLYVDTYVRRTRARAKTC